MLNINNVTLCGNIGNEPDYASTPSGTSRASFSLALKESWKDASGEKKEKTTWVRCTVWKGSADFVKNYIHKGDRVYVEGKLSSSEWVDKATGQKRSSLDVTATNVQIVQSKNKEGGQAQPQMSMQGMNQGMPQGMPQGMSQPQMVMQNQMPVNNVFSQQAFPGMGYPIPQSGQPSGDGIPF